MHLLGAKAHEKAMQCPLLRSLFLFYIFYFSSQHSPSLHASPPFSSRPVPLPVAIGLEEAAFPLARTEGLEHPYPPVAFVHFVRDNNTDAVSGCARECVRAFSSWGASPVLGRLHVEATSCGPAYGVLGGGQSGRVWVPSTAGSLTHMPLHLCCSLPGLDRCRRLLE